MPNLRLIHDNAADRATLTASSSVGALVAANLKLDAKSAVWRAAGSSARITAAWAVKERIGGIALPFCNLSKDATIRVRVTNEGTATNYLRYPKAIDNASIFVEAATGGVTLADKNFALAPNGTMTATRLTDVDTNIRNGRQQGFTVPNDSLPRVAAIFVKKTVGATSFPGFQIQFNSGGVVVTGSVTINTNTGVLTNRDNFPPSAKAAKDWGTFWRVEVALYNNNSGNTGCNVYFYPAVNNDASGAWGNAATGSSIVWFMSVEDGLTATSVIPDLTAFISRNGPKHVFDNMGKLILVAANVAAYDYDPVSHVSRGLSLEDAATNRLYYPRNLDNSIWKRLNATPYPGIAVGPDGNMSMCKLVESAQASSNHYLYQERTATNETVTFYVVARQAGRSRMMLEMSNFLNASANVSFDLLAGTIVSSAWVSTDYSSVYGSIDPLGGGVYLCAITVTKAAANNVNNAVIWLQNVLGQTSYAGDGVSGIEIFHTQLTDGPYRSSIIPDVTAFISRAGPKWEFNSAGVLTQYGNNVAVVAYDPVTFLPRGLSLESAATNLETWSSDFSNAAYSKVGLGTVTTNSSGAPDGSSTLNKLSEDSSNGLHTVARNVTIAAGQTYVVSRIVKAAEKSLVQLLFDDTTTTNGVYANFNLANGSVAKAITSFGTGAAVSYGIEPFGSGLFRVWISGTAGASATIARIATTIINTATAGPFPGYVGTAGYGLYVWGAQTALGTVPSTQIPTTNVTVTRAADVSTSPQATRAADLSSGPQSVRPIGFIDEWQSYQYDSGVVSACAGGPVVPEGWTPAVANANSYSYGGGNRAWAWLPKMDAYAVAIDVNDPSNPAGYVEAARLVVGDYWSPTYNFDYGRQLGLNDGSKHERSAAGNLETEIGTSYDSLSIQLKNMTDADLTSLVSILRRVGMRRSVFLSLYPESANRTLEREHQLLGKFMDAKSVLTSISYGYNESPLTVEQV